MSRCNVIVVGASAGGVASLMRLVSQLPSNLGAAVAVALHVPENSPSVLPAILSRRGPLPAAHARDGEPLLHDRIYVAPPARHLLIKRRTVRAVIGPHENGHRPAVDPLFRTAARAHGHRVIGVILSGSLDDGTAGLAAIKAAGGAAVVQDPKDALFDGMPSSAIEHVDVDFVGDVDAVAGELVRRVLRLCADSTEEMMPDESTDEFDAVEMDRGIPDPDTLLSEQANGIEDALWFAVRALEENAALLRGLHAKAVERDHLRTAEHYLSQANDVEARARIIREALMRADVSAA